MEQRARGWVVCVCVRVRAYQGAHFLPSKRVRCGQAKRARSAAASSPPPNTSGGARVSVQDLLRAANTGHWLNGLQANSRLVCAAAAWRLR